MKVLVTGANGQLGNELRELSGEYNQLEFLFTDEAELDITNETKIFELFETFRPEVVINCAAYTAVDKAETEEQTAYLINSTAPGLLSKASAKYGTLLIHISTDYVFDGKSWLPYSEDVPINPLSVYGKSKAAGEEAVHKTAKNAFIIRTSWLYSSFGNNFVKTILRYAKERGFLNIVFDQIGTPTYARDLAKTVLEIIPSALKSSGVTVYHFSNEGVISWYDFAKAIVEDANLNCKIYPINSSDYHQKAPRPFYSVLNKSKIKEKFSIDIPYWRESF